jgi:LuxR family maltose regulon positive regulatory protein
LPAAPLVPGGAVSRPRLFGRLGAPARVSVVSVPPGSGKTVLLRSWINWAGVAGSAAWVPAGRGERDPQRVLAVDAGRAAADRGGAAAPLAAQC